MSENPRRSSTSILNVESMICPPYLLNDIGTGELGLGLGPHLDEIHWIEDRDLEMGVLLQSPDIARSSIGHGIYDSAIEIT